VACIYYCSSRDGKRPVHAANQLQAQQQRSKWEHAAHASTGSQPARRETPGFFSFLISLPATWDLAGSPPVIIPALKWQYFHSKLFSANVIVYQDDFMTLQRTIIELAGRVIY